MSEREKNLFAKALEGASDLGDSADESTVLAITASYMAGKEAGKREAARNVVRE